MTWGIIGALDAEVALIKEQMTVEETREVYGSQFYSGTFGDQRVVVVCCSVGTINAAACTSVIIREFGAQAVVNVGIAGSSCRELHVLDVVVAEDVMFHDTDLDILEQYYPFARSFQADKELRDLCVRAMQSMEERRFQYKIGRIASGDVFVNSPELKSRIVEKTNPMCVEMEGAAVGQVAYMNKTPFLVIRTLSDNADEEAHETYDNFLEVAAENSARIILTMMRLHSQGK